MHTSAISRDERIYLHRVFTRICPSLIFILWCNHITKKSDCQMYSPSVPFLLRSPQVPVLCVCTSGVWPAMRSASAFLRMLLKTVNHAFLRRERGHGHFFAYPVSAIFRAVFQNHHTFSCSDQWSIVDGSVTFMSTARNGVSCLQLCRISCSLHFPCMSLQGNTAGSQGKCSDGI